MLEWGRSVLQPATRPQALGFKKRGARSDISAATAARRVQCSCAYDLEFNLCANSRSRPAFRLQSAGDAVRDDIQGWACEAPTRLSGSCAPPSAG